MKNIVNLWTGWLLIFLFLGVMSVEGKVDKDIDYLRAIISKQALAVTVDKTEVTNIISTIRPDGTWPGIDYKNVKRNAFQHTRHLSNLLHLAVAYKQEGSPFEGNKKVKQAFDKGVAYWVANDFQCENWWNNQIGTPSVFILILFAMDESLTSKQIEQILPIVERGSLKSWGARPGGDRIFMASMQLQTALFIRDVQQIIEVLNVIEKEIKFSKPYEQGIQYDYSFHHRYDRVNNTLSYGLQYINIFSEWAAIVSKTRFRFSDEVINMAVDYYLDGVCKQMIFGKTEDIGIQNRDITRIRKEELASVKIPVNLMNATNYRKDEMENIIKARQDKDFKAESFSKFFWQTEHFVFQRPGFYTSVRMFSTRNKNMEEPYNGEGLKNHYRGDGTNYFSVTGNEYFNISPVYDWMRIPGTTTMIQEEMLPPGEIQKPGIMEYVGAVSDGLYGAVAFDFISSHHPLRARKSWFFFDDEYVCLGAGIKAQTKYPVVTTLDQCYLEGEVEVSTANGIETVSKGEHQWEDADWIIHNKVGYWFPDKQVVSLKNEEASGTWYSVDNHVDVSKDTVRKDIFKLWLEHGVRPNGKNYSYVVVPAASPEKMNKYQKQSSIKILSNTSKMQAVEHKQKKIVYMACYGSSKLMLDGNRGDITMESAGLLMAQFDQNGHLSALTVADPSRQLSHLHLSFSGQIPQIKSSSIVRSYYDEIKQRTYLSVELPDGFYVGKSVQVLFSSSQIKGQ